MQADAEVQDTPYRKLEGAPAGLGVRWMRQCLPFQCSASVTSVSPSLPALPTAVHEVADQHDTPNRVLPGSLAGLGVGWTLQLWPFQCSARVTSAFALVM